MSLRIIATLMILFLLNGCNASVLPGMGRLNVGCMYRAQVPNTVCVNPVLIPITPSLLLNQPPPCYVYHVAPQDVLSIFVWMHPEFNPPAQITSMNATSSTQAAGISGYLVDTDGKIYFPLIGYVCVAGKTIDQVRIELTRRLKVYIPSPQVTVRVADYRSKKVYVLGEVMKPSLFPLNDQPMSLTDALTLAGSIDPNASDTRHIYVIRGDFINPRIYWLNARTPDVLLLAESFHLQPGDIVYVSSALVTDWNRFLNQFLPTIQAYWFTRSIVKNGN